jgi:hypothetical protein
MRVEDGIYSCARLSDIPICACYRDILEPLKSDAWEHLPVAVSLRGRRSLAQDDRSVGGPKNRYLNSPFVV